MTFTSRPYIEQEKNCVKPAKNGGNHKKTWKNHAKRKGKKTSKNGDIIALRHDE